MCWRTCRLFAEGGFRAVRAGVQATVMLAAMVVPSAAQEVPADLLLKPPPESWPTYHGDYSGQHYSRLTQITPANVNGMTLAWAFQTNLTQQIKSTPILVNGVMYLS